MQQLLRFRYQLNIAEWVIVVSIPLVMILAIRYVALFYIGLALTLVILAYIFTTLYEYYQLKKINKRRRKNFEHSKFHYSKMILYGLASFVLSFVYLMR